MTSSLVALSSAAVLAIYAAGYVKTRAAAEQIEAASQRRPMRAVPAGSTAAGPRQAAMINANAGSPAARTSVDSAADAATRTRSAGAIDGLRPEVTAPAAIALSTAATSAAAGSATAPVSAAIPSASTPSANAPARAASAGAPPAGLVASAAASPSPSAPASESVAAPAPKVPEIAAAVAAAVTYKDGTYLGWGSCRHGDIQAQVVVEGGRITSADISRCLTRYSCSWISPLPPEVVVRQSAEVDFVSGATDSTNAFYYAVIDALTKAK